jgi:hypothetical protein
MKDKTYIFKCGYKNGEHHCNGDHVFTLNDEFYRSLCDKMLFQYNLKVDKKMIFDMIDKFDEFIEKKIQRIK